MMMMMMMMMVMVQLPPLLDLMILHPSRHVLSLLLPNQDVLAAG